MKQISLLLLVVILAASCSKKDSLPEKKGKTLVKTSLDIGNNTEYNYDGQGRTSKVVSGDQEILYTYGSNTITEKIRLVSQNHTQSEVTYTLNNKGLAVSATGFYQTLPNAPISNVTITSTFDAEGRIILDKMTLGALNASTEYYYADGDMTEVKRFLNNEFTGKTKYYYPSKILNKTTIGNTDHQYIPGATHFGSVNKHLVEKVESIDKNGTVTDSFTSVYTLDADGYPVKRAISGNPANTIFYFYN